MKRRFIFLATLLAFLPPAATVEEKSGESSTDKIQLWNLSTNLLTAEGESKETASGKTVYVLPIRDDIMPPMVYVVRRGVKEAMDAGADLLILDLHTNGGRVDVTEEIIEILNKFKGQTATYVNRYAYSAGAFIAVSTEKIYMAPQGLIGAAAPIMMAPGGGASDMPSTMEVKMNSAIRAMVRTQAEKNGHDVDVIEAMIDKSKELVRDGDVICAEGDLLTLTQKEAETLYGDPPKPLLSLGTMESIDNLIVALGFERARRVDVEPLGAEQLGTWINSISPLLLLIGIIGLYIEFKTPGFGVFGVTGLLALTVYFFGGYVAGLAGAEWIGVFALGVILVVLEFFVLPGTIFLGLFGMALMMAALIMGMTDLYPGTPLIPDFSNLGEIEAPPMPDFSKPVNDLLIAFVLAIPAIWALGHILPKTSIYGHLVSATASGVESVGIVREVLDSRLGETGLAINPLHPGGKARFGDDLCTVVTQGELIEKGSRIKVIGHRGNDLLVKADT